MKKSAKLLTLCAIVSALAFTGQDGTQAAKLYAQQATSQQAVAQPQKKSQKTRYIASPLVELDLINGLLDYKITHMNGHPVEYMN